MSNLPFTCLSVDLEVHSESETIFALAGARSDGAGEVVYPSSGRDLTEALQALDELAEDGVVLLGHNIITFDSVHLRAHVPDAALLRLPVVDTLRLSPLAHPRNPYHRLVKHYKEGGLVRTALNDPYLDAKLTLDLLAEHLAALGRQECAASRRACAPSSRAGAMTLTLNAATA